MIAFLILTLFYDKNIAIASMIIGALSDSFAAIGGLTFGKNILINNKTLEGSCFFLFTTLIILICLLSDISYYIVLIASIIITFVELFTVSRFDNITVPLISGLIINYIISL